MYFKGEKVYFFGNILCFDRHSVRHQQTLNIHIMDIPAHKKTNTYTQQTHIYTQKPCNVMDYVRQVDLHTTDTCFDTNTHTHTFVCIYLYILNSIYN